jgi:hypothetical protein
VAGLWLTGWPALLFWLSTSGLLYADSGISASSRSELVAIATDLWTRGRGVIHLAWVQTPVELVCLGIAAGAIAGGCVSLLAWVLRVDRQQAAWSSLGWALTAWRRPFLLRCYLATVVLPVLVFLLFWFGRRYIPESARLYFLAGGFCLWVLIESLIVPILLVRDSVVGNSPAPANWTADLAVHRPRTWIAALASSVSVSALVMPAFSWLNPIDAVVVAVAAQALVSRDEPALRLSSLLTWHAVTSFWWLAVLLTLGLVLLVVPIATVGAFNVFGVPAIHQIFSAEGLPLPTLLRFEIKASDLLIRYWWIAGMSVVVPIAVPAYYLLQGRIAWTVRDYRRRDSCGVQISARSAR